MSEVRHRKYAPNHLDIRRVFCRRLLCPGCPYLKCKPVRQFVSVQII